MQIMTVTIASRERTGQAIDAAIAVAVELVQHRPRPIATEVGMDPSMGSLMKSASPTNARGQLIQMPTAAVGPTMEIATKVVGQ